MNKYSKTIQKKDDLYLYCKNQSTSLSRGQVISISPETTVTPPANCKSFTFIYVSESAKGELVPVSGILILPASPAPEKGYPLISWGHGTTGISPNCAPSLTDNLGVEIYKEELFSLLEEGFAVAATDYIGLGIDHAPHLYENAAEEGNAIADAVVASRAISEDISNTIWFSMGHSQGGSGAIAGCWDSSCSISGSPTAGVAVAPSGDFFNLPSYIFQSSELDSTHALDYFAFNLYSFSLIDKTVKLQDFFTRKGIKDIQASLDNYCMWRGFPGGCFAEDGESLFSEESFTRNAIYMSDENRRRVALCSNSEDGKVLSPILVVSGSQDSDVPDVMVDKVVKTLRENNPIDVDYKIFKSNHWQLLEVSFYERMSYMKSFLGSEG